VTLHPATDTTAYAGFGEVLDDWPRSSSVLASRKQVVPLRSMLTAASWAEIRCSAGLWL